MSSHATAGAHAGDERTRTDPSYYERPAIKRPVWIWSVPAYFFTGGVAGAAAILGAAAQAVDGQRLQGLVSRSRRLAAAGAVLGTAGLIHDLGRPERFMHMLRVFRPSSPMSVGSWVLAAAAPLAAGSAALADARGVAGRAGNVAGYGAGVLGLPLAGYTAVLLSSTAVPLWQATRTASPPLFIGSAMTGAAGLLQLMRLTSAEHAVVRRFAVAGAAVELASEVAMDREARRVERVATPLHRGRAGMLLWAGRVLTAAALGLNLWPGRSRARTVAAGLLATVGSAAVKFGLLEAGRASAEDPRATFHQQRAGLGAREATGRSAIVGSRGERAVP